ncbi:MAG: glycosyltransferase [Parcubacteria group bacterium]|jgi:glycosyltransferase involved in cell wall biosynthesis
MLEIVSEKNPLVSVVIPFYNHEKFIAKTIQSVLDQTYQNWEMLIVDDCSRDGSWSIIQEWAKKDSRIKAFRNNENKGLIPNWKFLIDNSKGDYIAFLEGDDVFYPENLKSKMRIFEQYPKIGMVYCNFCAIDAKGNILIHDYYKKLGISTYRNQMIQPAEYLYSKLLPFSTYSQIMIRKNVIAISGYPRSFALEEKIFLPSDWDFNFLVSTKNEIYYIDEILLQYRKHPNNNSADIFKVCNQLEIILDSYAKEYAGNEKMQKAIRYMRGKTHYFKILYYIENGSKKKSWLEFFYYSRKYPRNLMLDFRESLFLFIRLFLPNRINAYLKKLYLSS